MNLAVLDDPDEQLTAVVDDGGLISPFSFDPNPSLLGHSPAASLDLPDSQLEREASLLMFYLDHVFQLQFPFYCPSANEDGRVWLLSLLTSTKPVYYAALSLGALHWGMTLGQGESPELRHTLQEDEKRHHMLALQELQQFIKTLNAQGEEKSLRGCVNALAGLMQLIFLEVCVTREKLHLLWKAISFLIVWF